MGKKLHTFYCSYATAFPEKERIFVEFGFWGLESLQRGEETKDL